LELEGTLFHRESESTASLKWRNGEVVYLAEVTHGPVEDGPAHSVKATLRMGEVTYNAVVVYRLDEVVSAVQVDVRTEKHLSLALIAQADWSQVDASFYWDKGVDDSKKLALKAARTDGRISAEYDLVGVAGSVALELAEAGLALSAFHGNHYAGGDLSWWSGDDGTYGVVVKVNSSAPTLSRVGFMARQELRSQEDKNLLRATATVKINDDSHSLALRSSMAKESSAVWAELKTTSTIDKFDDASLELKTGASSSHGVGLLLVGKYQGLKLMNATFRGSRTPLSLQASVHSPWPALRKMELAVDTNQQSTTAHFYYNDEKNATFDLAFKPNYFKAQMKIENVFISRGEASLQHRFLFDSNVILDERARFIYDDAGLDVLIKGNYSRGSHSRSAEVVASMWSQPSRPCKLEMKFISPKPRWPIWWKFNGLLLDRGQVQVNVTAAFDKGARSGNLTAKMAPNHELLVEVDLVAKREAAALNVTVVKGGGKKLQMMLASTKSGRRSAGTTLELKTSDYPRPLLKVDFSQMEGQGHLNLNTLDHFANVTFADYRFNKSLTLLTSTPALRNVTVALRGGGPDDESELRLVLNGREARAQFEERVPLPLNGARASLRLSGDLLPQWSHWHVSLTNGRDYQRKPYFVKKAFWVGVKHIKDDDWRHSANLTYERDVEGFQTGRVALQSQLIVKYCPVCQEEVRADVKRLDSIGAEVTISSGRKLVGVTVRKEDEQSVQARVDLPAFNMPSILVRGSAHLGGPRKEVEVRASREDDGQAVRLFAKLSKLDLVELDAEATLTTPFEGLQELELKLKGDLSGQAKRGEVSLRVEQRTARMDLFFADNGQSTAKAELKLDSGQLFTILGRGKLDASVEFDRHQKHLRSEVVVDDLHKLGAMGNLVPGNENNGWRLNANLYRNVMREGAWRQVEAHSADLRGVVTLGERWAASIDANTKDDAYQVHLQSEAGWDEGSASLSGNLPYLGRLEESALEYEVVAGKGKVTTEYGGGRLAELAWTLAEDTLQANLTASGLSTVQMTLSGYRRQSRERRFKLYSSRPFVDMSASLVNLDAEKNVSFSIHSDAIPRTDVALSYLAARGGLLHVSHDGVSLLDVRALKNWPEVLVAASQRLPPSWGVRPSSTRLSWMHAQRQFEASHDIEQGRSFSAKLNAQEMIATIRPSDLSGTKSVEIKRVGDYHVQLAVTDGDRRPLEGEVFLELAPGAMAGHFTMTANSRLERFRHQVAVEAEYDMRQRERVARLELNADEGRWSLDAQSLFTLGNDHLDGKLTLRSSSWPIVDGVEVKAGYVIKAKPEAHASIVKGDVRHAVEALIYLETVVPTIKLKTTFEGLEEIVAGGAFDSRGRKKVLDVFLRVNQKQMARIKTVLTLDETSAELTTRASLEVGRGLAAEVSGRVSWDDPYEVHLR